MAETTGLRTKIYRGESQANLTAIGKVANITPPGGNRQTVDIEELDPPDDVLRSLAGAITLSDVTLTVNLDGETQAHLDLQDDFYSGALRYFKIELPSGYGWDVFPALVTGWEPQEIAQDSVVQAQVTLRPQAKPQFKQLAS